MKKSKPMQVRKTVPRAAQGPIPKSRHSGSAGHPYMNTANVKGLFSPFGGGGAADAPGSTGGSGGGFFSLFNRIGGLDGILSTMGKVQKMFAIMKQMSPIFKLMGGLGGLAGIRSLENANINLVPPRRKHAAKPGKPVSHQKQRS